MAVSEHHKANEILERTCAGLRSTSPPRQSSIALTCLDSPIGTLLLGAQNQSICLLEFCDVSQIESRVFALHARFGCEVWARLEPVLELLIEQLSGYFSKSLRLFDVPLLYRGSTFQQQVWSELLRIPYGQTCSYLTIAQRVGDTGATRAVGAANHHNPIAIVIPCHRVINANGELGGYGGEVWRKRWLLDLECGQSQFAF